MKKEGFFSVLLSTLGASLLGNLSTGKGGIAKSQGPDTIRANKGTFRAGEGTVRVGQDF